MVREIRSHKFPDLREYGTAGSFFKNPILSQKKYEELIAKYGSIPQFPNPNGIKIPLAFVLDKVLSLRGYNKGNAFLFGAQPLVLVLSRNGRAEEVEQLAKKYSFIKLNKKNYYDKTEYFLSNDEVDDDSTMEVAEGESKSIFKKQYQSSTKTEI